MSVKKPPTGFLRDAYATHQRGDNDKMSKTKKRPEKQNESKTHEKSESEKDRLLGSTANSHSGQRTSHRSKSRDILKKSKSSQEILEKIPKDSGSSKHGNHRLDEHPRQSSSPRDDNDESNEDCDEGEEEKKEEENEGNDEKKEDKEEKDDDGKVVTAGSLTRKSEAEETDDTRGTDAIEKPLNHRRSFQPGRWGMSVSSPPAEFLRDASRRAMHRKNKERTSGKKDTRVHRTDRWNVSVSLSPGKEFLEDTSKHRRRGRGEGHGTERSTVKSRSRPGEVKGSSSDRSPASQRQPDLQTNLTWQPMTDERANEEFASSVLGKAPSGAPGRLADRWESDVWRAYRANIDFNNNPFPRNTIMIREIAALWSNVDFGAPTVANIPAHHPGRVRIRSPSK